MRRIPSHPTVMHSPEQEGWDKCFSCVFSAFGSDHCMLTSNLQRIDVQTGRSQVSASSIVPLLSLDSHTHPLMPQA
jgi:hypothetical protein